MSVSNLLLGIDGGGSKTIALLADSQQAILGRGAAGASNHNLLGAGAALEALDQAVRSAFEDAKIAPAPPRALCLGMAGAGRPADIALFQAWAAERWPGTPVAVVSDADLVLAAGLGNGWGLGLICGTGSIAYGRDRSGITARAGGWGSLLGDEGSGYAIGLAGLRAVARAADGRGPATVLTDTLLGHWSLAAPQSLIQYVYSSASRSEIAELAGLVDDAAASGDSIARQIIAEAQRELALALNAVAAQLRFAAPTACVMAGGLLVNRPAFMAGILAEAWALGLMLQPVDVVLEPAVGAIQLARQLAGMKDASACADPR